MKIFLILSALGSHPETEFHYSGRQECPHVQYVPVYIQVPEPPQASKDAQGEEEDGEDGE